MNVKRPLTPGFLNSIDRKLLKNNPVTWSTRIHLVLYYVLAFAIIITIIGFLVPDDPGNYSTIYNWIILLSIISFLAFIFWMIYLLRFNVFKRFGRWGRPDTVKTFIMYFFIIILIVSVPFIPPIIQSIRANASYTSDELARDMNNMNIRICQLERDSIDTRFARDTFQVKDSIKGSIMRNTGYDENLELPVKNNYYFIDTATLNNKLAVADSIKRIADSIYVIFHCPAYTFINNYSVNNKSRVKVLGSIDLFRQVVQYHQTIDTPKVKKELATLFSKYSHWHKENILITAYDYYTGKDELNYADRVEDKYDLHYINNAMHNITGKKYRWDNDSIAVSWRVAYYIALVLALLVLIYRHTTRKTFFLSLLSAVILTIVTGLFLAVSNSYDAAFFIWVIVYFIIFSILTATMGSSSRRNVVSGIGLNLLVFITAFMPLVITATYYTILHEKYRYNDETDNYYYLKFINEELHYFVAEIAGFILLLICLATLYQAAYRKWYSLPEQ